MIWDWAKLVGRAVIWSALIVAVGMAALYLIFPAGS